MSNNEARAMRKKNSGNKTMLPTLRLPEFAHRNGWQPTEVGKFLKEYVERASSGTELPVYSSTRSGLQPQKDYYDDRELANEGEYGVVPHGHFVYRHMSDDDTFKFNINQLGKSIAVSKEYPVFSVEGINPYFLQYLLNESSAFKRFAIAQKKGGTRTRLYLSILRTFSAHIPEPDEQSLIANCLRSLDDGITAAADKLEALKTHKKGLVQRLFPTLGETTPQIRLSDFAHRNGWQPTEIGKFLKEYVERASSGTELPVYSSTRSGLQPQKDYYDDRELANEGEYGVVPHGYFVYRHMSDDDTFKFNINQLGKSIAVSKEYPVFSVEGMNPYFLQYLLNESSAFKRFAIAQKKGGTRTRLYLSILRTFSAHVPEPDEQSLIANCLRSLDDGITAAADKLEALKTHKKGLVQRLFPTIEEGEA